MGIILDLINAIEDKDEDVLYEDVCKFIDKIVKDKKFNNAMKVVEKESE